MRRFSLLILICVFLPSLAGAATNVRIALDQSPPTSFLDDRGHAAGFFPDLFNQMAKELDWSVSYVPCEWEQCLDQLEAGEIDIIPGIAYTEERTNRFQFAAQTVLSSWGQVFSRTDTNLASILDLNGMRVAVLTEDVYFTGERGLKKVAEHFGLLIDFVLVASYEEAFTALSSGSADAAMVGRIFGVKNREKYNLVPSSILIKPIQARPAFSLHSPSNLVAGFDRLLAQWKKQPDSIYFHLMDKWLAEEQSLAPPPWLKGLMYSLAILLLLLFATTFWTRKQVKLKTLQLAEKNQELENELIERKAIEKELLERQQQYQVFFENSHSVILFIDPETGTIVDANDAACQFYMYSREQLKGMNIKQISNLSKKELQEVVDKAHTHRQQHFEFTHKRADGQQRPVEVHSTPIKVEGKTLLCSIIHDISQRKRTEQALAERTSFLQSVIDGVSDPLMVIGLDHRILQINRAAREQIKREDGFKEPLTCHDIFHRSSVPCDEGEHDCPIREVKETGCPATVIHQHETTRGKRIYEITASPLFDFHGQLHAIIEVSRDITERMQIEELLNENEKRLLHLAHHDTLTELPNRLLFEDRLYQALSKARRSRRQVALFFLDLDNFKAINDNLGHDYGDRVLVDAAKRLRSCVRESDTVARMGGDEFLILLEDVESIAMIEATAERVGKALSHEVVEGEFRQHISCSIGISIFPEDAASGKDLLKNADIAMYKAKKEGRANYQFFATPQARFVFD